MHVPRRVTPLQKLHQQTVRGMAMIESEVRTGASSLGPGRARHAHLGLLSSVAMGRPLLRAHCRTYGLRSSLLGVEEGRRVMRASNYSAALLGMCAVILHVALSRPFVALLVPIVVALIAASRLIPRTRTSDFRSTGRCHRVVAAGNIGQLRGWLLPSNQGAKPIEEVVVVAYVLDDDAIPNRPRRRPERTRTDAARSVDSA